MTETSEDGKEKQASPIIDARLVPIEVVAAFLSVSVSTAERMKAAGELPSPIRFSRRLIRWDIEELREWVQRRKPNGKLLSRDEWAAVIAARKPK